MVLKADQQQTSPSLSRSTLMTRTTTSNTYQPQPQPQQQRQPVSVSHITSTATSSSVLPIAHDAATTARFLARLGLDDAVFGKLYYTLHTPNTSDDDRDTAATLPYCFATSMAPALAALCPMFWAGSAVRPCGAGTDGYTCMVSRHTSLPSSKYVEKSIVNDNRKKKEEVREEVKCGTEFAPVCCQINERVHATHNYCECKRAGGIFRRAGASCEGVGTMKEEREENH